MADKILDEVNAKRDRALEKAMHYIRQNVRFYDTKALWEKDQLIKECKEALLARSLIETKKDDKGSY